MARIANLFLLFVLVLFSLKAQLVPQYSTAGFYEYNNSGRKAINFNIGWRFYKGNANGAEEINFNDSHWELVNLPHGSEYLPVEASGGINYQGPVWYRKQFLLDKELYTHKKIMAHFEAIMGKSKIWVNGKFVSQHFGGYLPVIIDITNFVTPGAINIIAVLADNTDDGTFPPGKPQGVTDFAYFGGIYRDCWLVSHNKIYITQPNYVNEIAGGGVTVHYSLGAKGAIVFIGTHLANVSLNGGIIKVAWQLIDGQGSAVGGATVKKSLAAGASANFETSITLKNPNLWSPEDPYRYSLLVKLYDERGKLVDALIEKIGIRSIEFKGKEGFYLNGVHYPFLLSGANRHQDFAIIGNALPNSIHWRDVKKLRSAGFRIIRSAHYPQDPAFMDACDELGMFVIATTEGWQWWENTGGFEQRVYDNVRQLVRRDRNHPSVIFWEPILNETNYPATFAKNVHDIVHQEYPWPGAYTACDDRAAGKEYFDILYGFVALTEKTDKPIFCREWGDNVCDFSAHNSTSRVAREWGEAALLFQAIHYARPVNYKHFCLDALYAAPPQFAGGTLWHAFDHQRGYHCDPFYGGIMDAYRQPKPSYFMFASQRAPEIALEKAAWGPMELLRNYIYICKNNYCKWNLI